MDKYDAAVEARATILSRMLASGLSVRVTQDELTPAMCYALFEAMARRVSLPMWHTFLREALDETLERMAVTLPTERDD